MVGTLKEVLQNMEDGVTNFCVNGECSGCGQCCSALLPISSKEIKEIKRYVKKKHISTVNHNAPAINQYDLTCPFLDISKDKEKCRIYPVRPMICRTFKCDTPPSKIRKNKEMFWRQRKGVYMWDIRWEEE